MTTINQNDLINLNKIYHKNSSSMHFIYGASKSGKTTFIKDFMIKKNVLYLSFTNMMPSILFPNIAKNIAKKFNIKTSYQLYTSFKNILLLIDELVKDEKLTLVFDDFDNLLKLQKDTFDILFKIWNNNLKYKNIQLILLSSIKFDEKINNKISKFSTFDIYIQKIYFADMIGKSDTKLFDKIYIHSCFGSSNHILSFYDKKLDFIKNLYKISMNPQSIYFNFGIDYLKINISDISTYTSILHAISIGNNKIVQIATFLNVDSTYLSRYLKKLQDLMIIKKYLPIKDNHKFSKLGRYHIENNFLKFWYCYIFPNQTNLVMKRHNLVIKQIDSSIVEKMIIPVYIGLLKKLLKDNSLSFLGYELKDLGSWWDNMGNNIDIVTFITKTIDRFKEQVANKINKVS